MSCGADCTRDRSCASASGSLGVCDSASSALGRSVTDLEDRLGEHEKRLEKKPFCAFATDSVFKSAVAGTLAPGDADKTIENRGCWGSRSDVRTA